MKTVLRNKARNIHKKLDIQEQREAAASNFDESIFDSLITEDSYALETMMPFRVKEQVFVVTPHIGNALSAQIQRCFIVILHCRVERQQNCKVFEFARVHGQQQTESSIAAAQADHGARQGCRNFYLMKRFAKLSTVIHRAFAPSWSTLRDISIDSPCGRVRISTENRAPT